MEKDPVIAAKEALIRDLMSSAQADIEGQDFTHVKAGDTVTRMLAGVVEMTQTVVKVDDALIYTGHPQNGWRFWRSTGFEYDPDLDLPEGTICSYLTGVVR